MALKTSDVKDIVIILAIGVAAYYLKDILAGAGSKLKEIGENVGGTVYDFFHPDELGTTTFYTVTFPDGARHSIGSKAVRGDGTFDFVADGKNIAFGQGDGKTYQLIVDQQGYKFAIEA